MRERILNQIRVTPAVWHCDYYRSNGSLYTVSNSGTSREDGKYSRMIDAGSRRKDDIRTRYLEHHSISIESSAIKLDYPYPVAGTSGRVITTCHGATPYSIRANPWIMSNTYVEQAIFDAFRYFESGCAPVETLLANFAWELPDVKRLWPTLKEFFKVRKHTASNKETKRDLKSASSMYLGYNFGVVPLVGDLITIYQRLKGLSDHIAWLRKTSGKMTKVEFRTGLPLGTWDPNLPYYPPSTSEGNYRKITEHRAGFKAWAILTYDVSALSDIDLRTKTLMRSFGLNNPAAILWEAVPYSFVVDWVSNVGDLISRLEVPIKLPVVFHDCGFGAWEESTFEEWCVYGGSHAKVRTVRTRGYSRRPGLPISISKLSLETPTAKQLSLGLALLGQKF